MLGRYTHFGSRHKPGKTFVAFDPVERRIISASADGKLRVYTNKDDLSPQEFVVGEKVNFIICKGEHVIVATEGSHVYMQQISDGLLEGIATRFTAGVNCLALNKDKSKLMAGSSDFIVKIVDLTNSDEVSREVLLKGHTGPILSVDFDPLDNFAASASCDGTVRIWKLNEAKEIKSLQILLKCNDPELALTPCRLKWQPSNGEFLAIPVENFIRLYERMTWAFLRGLRCPSVQKPFIECAFSPTCEILAGMSADGWLVLWKPDDGTVIHKIQETSLTHICSMIWPERTVIYCGDNTGAIGIISVDPTSFNQSTAIGTGGLSPNAINALMDTTDGDDFADLLTIAAAQAEEEARQAKEELDAVDRTQIENTDDDFINDYDDDNSNSIAISKIKSSYMVLDDNDNAMSDAPTSPTTANAAMRQGAFEANSAPAPPAISEIKPFQPGSMPHGFRERFLVWNRVGVVTSFDEEEDDGGAATGSTSGIQAEFHDTTLHHSLHLNNATGFSMADLSLTALMLATTGSGDISQVDAYDAGRGSSPDDDLELSTILVRPVDTSAGAESSSGSADWLTTLPPGEASRAICLVSVGPETTRFVDPHCRGYAVVATSSRLLRIFAQPAPSAASSGNALRLLQTNALGLPPISLPGREVVAMASHPFLPILAVVVGWSNEDLYWRVFNLAPPSSHGSSGVARGWLFGQLSSTFYPIPLSPVLKHSLQPNASARLAWFGFSDTGNLFTHDTSGVVRRLVHYRTSVAASDFHWVPVCDTRRAVKPQNRRNDCYFVVAVIESTKQPISAGDGGAASRAAALLDGDGEEEEDAVAGEAEARMQKIKSDALGYGQVQAVYCKASRWPRVIPKPVVATLHFHIPLCGEYSFDQADLEENYLRTVMQSQEPFWGTSQDDDELRQLEALQSNCLNDRKRVLLRLFALATKLDSDWAALTVANIMPDPQTVQLAIRYAARLGRQNLASRLGEVALRKEEAFEEEEQDDHDGDADEEEQAVVDEIGDQQSNGDQCETEGEDDGDSEPPENDDDVDEDDEAGSNELPSALAVPPSQGSTSLFTENPPSQQSIANSPSQRGRFNPFKHTEGNRSSGLTNGRGSSALDSLKPPPTAQSTASASTEQSKMAHGRRSTKPNKAPQKSRALKQVNSKDAQPELDVEKPTANSTAERKRPLTGGVKQSTAKRISSFAFKENQ